MLNSNNKFGSLDLENNDSFSPPIFPCESWDLFYSNEINGINDYDKFNNDIPPYYSIIDHAELEKKSIPKPAKSTQPKTNQKKDENDEPKLYTSNDIINIFTKESNKNKINEDFKSLKFSENIEDELKLTRTKKKIEFFLIKNKDNKNKKKKRGRKKKNANRVGVHDKMCSDNIIKKVKTAIFNYILFFLNNILSLCDEACSLYNIKLAKLNKKYVNEMKKEKEFEILNMCLKEIFSKDISLKKKQYKSNFNKKIIENILNNKNKKVDDTLLFVFNMTLRNWLDIFTLKKCNRYYK